MADNKSKFLWIGGAGLLAYLVYDSFNQFKARYSVAIARVKFNDALSRANFYARIFFDVTLNVNNPSSFQGQIKGVKLDVVYGGRVIGYVQTNNVVSIGANGTTPVVVSVGVPVATIWEDISTALMALAQRKPIILTISGSVYTNAGTINLNERVSVSY